MTKYTTAKLGLERPMGTIGATSDSAGTVTEFKTTGALDAGVVEGADVTVLRPSTLAIVGRSTINEVDSVSNPKVVSFNDTFAGACASGDILFLDEPVDVETWLNANLDILDQQALGAYVCTSISRPSIVYTGQIIFETDTNFMYRYDGASWVILQNTATVKTGYKGRAEDTGLGANIAAGAQMTTPFPEITIAGMETGRVYRFHAFGNVYASAHHSVPCHSILRTEPAANPLTNASASIATARSDVGDLAATTTFLSFPFCLEFYYHNSSKTGSHKFGLFLSRVAWADGKSARYNGVKMLIEDMGTY